MKNKNGKKLSILAIAGLTCLIPGLIVGCGNKNSDTDLFFTRGIKVTCGESLTTLNVDGAKLKDGSGNYYLFLKNEAGEAVDLSETGSHEVVNPTIAPKNGTEDYFLRVKIQYLGITGSKVKEIEDVDDYFTVVPTFSNEWLLCDDGYYYNVKDGVVEWNRENKSSQLKVENGNSQQIALFGSNSRSYVVSESAYISYSYIGARVVVEAVNSKGATDSSLASQGWTFQTNKTTGLKLIYDMNGGTESELSPIENLREGSKVAISSTIPTRTGYTFVGWNTSSTGNGKSYEAGSKVKIGQTNLTLYAEWEANTYNAQFDTNGGSFTPGETILAEYTYGKEVNLPTPVKEGYTFDGWYDADGNRVAFITKTTMGDLSLTAKWSLKKYKITLNENYGTMEYSIEQGAILPTDIKKEGYTFEGWYESYTPATGSEPEKWEGKRTEVANTEKGNKSFYAKWTIKSYLIHLDLQDGILYGENIDGQTKEFGSALPTKLEKDGYIFNDWAISAQGGKTYTSVGDFGDVSEITLYAQWIPKKMSIIFNSNGGTIDDSAQEVVKMVGFNSEIGELPVPSRLGYAFRGWFIDRYFSGEALTEDSIWLEYSTTRVYAKWEALPTPYTVEYYLEEYDGTFVKHLVENKTAPTDSAVSVELKSFSGFEHNENDNDILQGTVAPDGSLLLKIYYTRKYFSISYELDGGSFDSEEGKTSYRYGEVYEFPAVSKHGYRFLGWYKDAEFTGNAVTGITSEDVGNISFYAKFDQILFNVKLNMLGGSLKEGEADVTEHTYGYETKLPILEREGCMFGGWFDNAEFNGDAIEVIPAEVKCDTEYFAKWLGLENPVSFVTNGGTIQSNWISTYPAFHVTELPIVTRPGYKFLGWYDNAEFEGRCYEAITEEVLGEMTFYAKWGDGEITFSVEGPTGVSFKDVDLPTAYTNSEHAETYTIPSLEDITVNNKNLAVRYVKVNDSGAKNKIGSTFTLYGDTKITFVYDYVTDLEVKGLVNEGQTIIEATTIRQWGEGASLKFILPEPQNSNQYYEISWNDGTTTLYSATSYTASTYGIKVTLTPTYMDLGGEGAYVIPDNKSYKLKTKDGIRDFNEYGSNPVLLRVTEGENNFYAPDCRVIEGYRFLGWLKTFNSESSEELKNLIKPGDIISFDVENDQLIGFWEYDTYTITIDSNGGEIFDMYSREKISTEFIIGDSSYNNEFRIESNNGIGGYKIVDGEKYILGGFEIVSPVDYEELGYKINLNYRGINIERVNEENSTIRFGHDFKIKAIWTNDYMNQKIKINRKAGEHVYLDGKEVSELTYDGTIWIDEFQVTDGLSIDYNQRLTFKKDGENCVGRLIITTKDGLEVGAISEGMGESGFLAIPGGLIGEIEWTKAYTAKVEKGSIPGVEITGEDVYLTYDESSPYLPFSMYDNFIDRDSQKLTGFYYAEGYYCDGFKGYTIDTNEEVTEENISEHLGNVYFVPVWKKIEGSFNPGSIVENGETINAIMKNSFITSPINEFYASDGYQFGAGQLIDCLEVPGYPNYRIAGLNINGKDYVNLVQMATIYWKEAKYLVKSDESGDTYIYLTEDNSRDPETGEQITTLTGKFKLIKDGKTIEEGDLVINDCDSYYEIKKQDGTVLAYKRYDDIYSGLIPDTNSDIIVDESSKIILSTDVDESDPYYTYFKQNCYDGGYSKYYDLGDGYRYACWVEESGIKHEFLMWKEGESINASTPDYRGNWGGAKVLYTNVNGEEKNFNFFKYNDEFYSVGNYSKYDVDSSARLQGESTIFEQDITVLWTKDYVYEVEDKEEFESAEEEEETINAVQQEMQNLRNLKEKYSEKYISGYQCEIATGTILEGGNKTILSAFQGDMSIIMTGPKETSILLYYMNTPLKYFETKTTKSTEITVDGSSYSWAIVGDEIKLTNKDETITSVNKVLEINGKTYTADFSLLGLELKAEDGTAVIGHAYFSEVSYVFGYDICLYRYELYRKNGEDYMSKISFSSGFIDETSQTFVYEILDGPMPEDI